MSSKVIPRPSHRWSTWQEMKATSLQAAWMAASKFGVWKRWLSCTVFKWTTRKALSQTHWTTYCWLTIGSTHCSTRGSVAMLRWALLAILSARFTFQSPKWCRWWRVLATISANTRTKLIAWLWHLRTTLYCYLTLSLAPSSQQFTPHQLPA